MKRNEGNQLISSLRAQSKQLTKVIKYEQTLRNPARRTTNLSMCMATDLSIEQEISIPLKRGPSSEKKDNFKKTSSKKMSLETILPRSALVSRKGSTHTPITMWESTQSEIKESLRSISPNKTPYTHSPTASGSTIKPFGEAKLEPFTINSDQFVCNHCHEQQNEYTETIDKAFAVIQALETENHKIKTELTDYKEAFQFLLEKHKQVQKEINQNREDFNKVAQLEQALLISQKRNETLRNKNLKLRERLLYFVEKLREIDTAAGNDMLEEDKYYSNILKQNETLRAVLNINQSESQNFSIMLKALKEEEKELKSVDPVLKEAKLVGLSEESTGTGDKSETTPNSRYNKFFQTEPLERVSGFSDKSYESRLSERQSLTSFKPLDLKLDTPKKEEQISTPLKSIEGVHSIEDFEAKPLESIISNDASKFNFLRDVDEDNADQTLVRRLRDKKASSKKNRFALLNDASEPDKGKFMGSIETPEEPVLQLKPEEPALHQQAEEPVLYEKTEEPVLHQEAKEFVLHQQAEEAILLQKAALFPSMLQEPSPSRNLTNGLSNKELEDQNDSLLPDRKQPRESVLLGMLSNRIGGIEDD